MSKIHIFLKSGHTVKITCDSWEVTRNGETGEYTGYSYKGLKSPKAFGVNITQIAGWEEK